MCWGQEFFQTAFLPTTSFDWRERRLNSASWRSNFLSAAAHFFCRTRHRWWRQTGDITAEFESLFAKARHQIFFQG